MLEPLTGVSPEIDQSIYQTDRYRCRQRWGVGWRWQKARWIVEQGLHVSKKREDDLTIEAVRYQRLLARCEATGNLGRVEKKMPAFVQARALSLTFGRQRLELQSRLLARQSDCEIADATELSETVVAAFEGLFFAVRDWLHATSFIDVQVIGVPIGPAQGVPSIEALMQLSAYHHGPAVIGAWLTYIDHLANPTAAGPLDLSTTAGRVVAAIGLQVAVAHLPADEATNLQLLKLFPLLVRISKEHSSMQSASEIFSEQAAKSVGDFPWEAIEAQLGEQLRVREPVSAGEDREVA